MLTAACTAEVKVTGGDGGFPDEDSGKGGSSTGGATNTGGSKAGAGGSTGGATSTGGGGTTSTGGNAGDGRATCDPATAPDDCTKCADENCCQDYTECQNDRCYGTVAAAGADGELYCMIDCLSRGVSGQDGGGANRAECETKCKGNNNFLDLQTRAVMECLVKPDSSGKQVCGVRCFGTDVL